MMMCHNHPGQPAQYRCDKCQIFFCETCITVRKMSEEFTAFICKACGGKCEPITKQRTHKNSEVKISVARKVPQSQNPESKSTSFWIYLPGIIIFPFKNMGLPIAIVFAVLFFGCDWPLRYFHSWGLFALTILTTYYLVFLFKVADDSARGSVAMESLPNLSYWLDVVQPAVYAGMATLICFAPSSLYFLNSQSLDFIFLTLLGGGIFLFPMFIVRIIVMRDPYALNPFWVISSIAKTFMPYVFMCLLIAVFMSGQFYLNTEYLTDLGQGGLALSQLLMVMMWVVFMRLLGLFARFYRGRLNP